MFLVLDINVTFEVAGRIGWSMNGRLFIARRVGIQNDHMERAVHPATIGKALIDGQIIIRQPFFLEYSQFSSDIARAFPKPSFHNCNYGIFIGWCP